MNKDCITACLDSLQAVAKDIDTWAYRWCDMDALWVYALNLDKPLPASVTEAELVGLFTAYADMLKGFHIITITAKDIEQFKEDYPEAKNADLSELIGMQVFAADDINAATVLEEGRECCLFDSTEYAEQIDKDLKSLESDEAFQDQGTKETNIAKAIQKTRKILLMLEAAKTDEHMSVNFNASSDRTYSIAIESKFDSINASATIQGV